MIDLIKSQSIDIATIWMALMASPFALFIAVMLWIVAPAKMLVVTIAFMAAGYVVLISRSHSHV